MKHLILILLFPLFSIGQQIDTVIVTPIYKAYISKQLKQPVYVKYKLYKGGGTCKRPTQFTNPTKLNLLDTQYEKSGYDRGHLANAEDFAYDCTAIEQTFRYYNVLPQTHNLNRGIWKQWEEKIRTASQTDSLLVFAGGIWETHAIKHNMRIPTKCWKVVYNLSKNQIMYIVIFTNTQLSLYHNVTLNDLQNRIGFKLDFSY